VTLPLFEETYSVSRLGAEIRDFLAEAYGSVWVAGEVQRPRLVTAGHLYFDLVEKGERDAIVGRLDAVIWRRDYERLRRVLSRAGLELADGQEIRCRASVDFFAPGGRLQIVVREVDPQFSEGLLARRRRETLEALAAAGLLDRNRALAWPELPLRVGLVTSEGSAAYHDFLATLRESGYAFRIVFLHTAVQGRDAERQIVSALAALAGLAVDCAVLVRGGGSRTDLAVFDARALAEAVALAPFPVITGLGHEIDEAVADRVAHTAVKTPTKAAELLVERVATAERRLTEARAALQREALHAVRRGREALLPLERALRGTSQRVAVVAGRLQQMANGLATAARARLRVAAVVPAALGPRLVLAAPRLLGRARQQPALAAVRLVSALRGRLHAAELDLSGRERLIAGLGPERTLRRGYSVTRLADGRLLTGAGQVRAGDLLVTQLATGRMASRVETAEE
jgi:exodeoxyribonuclease VII large subunit